MSLKRKRLIFSASIILALFTFSCEDQPIHNASFYHWKSSISSDTIETDYLNQLQCNQVYLRLFDVQWVEEKAEAFPFAQLQISQDSLFTSQEIIPTVYITNESLLKTSDEQIYFLARNINDKAIRLGRQIERWGRLKSELHLDCDWTPSTREKFFQLIEVIRKQNEWKEISCTIRLHQFKYPIETGVPPVDYGVLMCYNMGDLGNLDEENSILNLETTKKYLTGNSYSLNLKVALPLFSWGIQFRNDKPIELINGLRSELLRNDQRLSPIGNHSFAVKEGCFLGSQYVYEGDVIKVEQVTKDQLQSLVDLLESKLENPSFDIVFYHLDASILSHYPIEELQEILE